MTAETDALRRDLLQHSDLFQSMATPPGEMASPAEGAAYLAALMAANYAYTLAAVLRYVRDEYGADAAERVAARATRIITDGDEWDMNADLDPAVTP